MLDSLNVNSISVDENGRVTFSGLGSGIDFQGTVDAIIAARRAPVDTLETRISNNELKITALKQLKTTLEDFKTSLGRLYGSVSVGNTNDIFETKQAFATTSRIDGGTASAAANLMGITVTASAAQGSHDVELLRTATAHKVSSDAIASLTTALGFSEGDSFTINDPDGVARTINVNSAMTLLDLRDAINAANKGTTATGVTASIVSVSSSEHYLLMTKDDTGAAMTVADTSGTPLADVGILTGAAFKNELQAAQTAQLYVDGVLDQTNTVYESNLLAASTAQIGSTGQLNFGATYGTVAYNATDTLQDLATNITAAHADLTATVVSDGAGVRLEIIGAAAFTITEDLAGTAIDDLGIDNKRKVIERTSNTVADLFTGVTLNLFQAEKGTTIKVEIDQDLNQIKTEIAAFVDAYNALKVFLNGQRQDRPEGAEDDDLTGVLISNSVLEQVETRIGSILNSAVAGLTGDFKTLPQLALDTTITTGISFARDPADPLLAGTLEINESKLDEALLNKTEEFRELFTFGFTSSDSRVRLLSFDGDTTYNAAGFTVNIDPATGGNEVLYSEQLDDAGYWLPVSATVSADGAAAPDGTNTADGLVGDAVAGQHYITTQAPVSVTAGTTYEYSTYVKAGNQDGARLQFGSTPFMAATYADFDLTNGTIVQKGNGVEDATISDAGNGWYRVSIKATAQSAGGAFIGSYAKPAGAASYTGDGASVDAWFWGQQVQPASDASSYLSAPSTLRSTISNDVAVPTAPDGTMTADGIVSDSTNNSHGITQADISITAGQQYTFESYVHLGDAPTRTDVRLNLAGLDATGNNLFASQAQAEFDLNTGTLENTGSGADSASITDVGSGWYRVSVTATAISSGPAGTVTLYPVDDSAGLGFTGDDVTVDTYYWEPRVIPATTPQIYVQTTTTAVAGKAATANIDGAADGSDDGSATVSGHVITVNSGDASGLKLFFDGFSLANASSAQVDYTVGVGAQLFFEIDSLLLDTSETNANGESVPVVGPLASEIDSLTDQNTLNQERVDRMLERLEVERQSLLQRFIAMETALAQADSIMQSLQQTMDAISNSKN